MTEQSSSPTYRPPRLFVEGDLAAGVIIPLNREQGRYLLTVMRRAAGAQIHLFNGRDGEWASTLVQTGRDKAVLQLSEQTRQQPPSGQGPWLMFSAVKRSATEFIIEKATELGVSRLIPVRSRRSNTERLNRDRLIRIARESAEQSERVDVPEIMELTPLADALEVWPNDRLLIVGDETGAAPAATQRLQACDTLSFGLLVGPEGGFAQDELDALNQLDFVLKVGLGPRVLRAETAAIVGLTLGQSILGDFATARGGAGIGN
ncbi:MAG: 16S rRNA (uracil(1498)-N(3))-methyltransferase [Alphaproteobacteria bacterium]